MTALPEYQRLECQALWRDGPGTQRREVIVAFGDATLVIADARSDRALAHWSLAAVLRRNPGDEPALYSPGADAAEELEIADEAMIAAIAKVHAMIGAQRPHPGRLRGWLSGAGLLLLLGGVFLWLPGALLRQTATALPAAMRAAIGEAIVADLARRTGAPCAAPEGRAALGRLAAALIGPGARIFVLPEGPAVAIRLPGRIFLLGRGLIEDHDGPDLATAQLLAAAAAGDADDGVIGFLRHAGTGATFRLLTSGALPEGAASGYGAGLLAAAQRAGPVAATQVAAPALDDSDWVALQGICGG